jgi:hypothetical protein
MKNYCVDLKFDIPPFIDTSFIETIPKDEYQYKASLFQHINPRFLLLLHNIGLTVYHIPEVFYCRANSSGWIHSDMLNDTVSKDSKDFTRINFSFLGKNSIMNWYSVNNDEESSIAVTSIGAPSHTYKSEQVTHIHSQSVSFPSIVQVGIPHNVTTSNEDRICYSIMPLKNNIRLSMDEAIEVFKPYIKV